MWSIVAFELFIYLNKLMDSVPKGGLNKGMLLALQFYCPRDCVCDGKKLRVWHHSECGDPSFIT